MILRPKSSDMGDRKRGPIPKPMTKTETVMLISSALTLKASCMGGKPPVIMDEPSPTLKQRSVARTVATHFLWLG